MRTLGWNIEFLATRGDILFAGTFQPDQNAFMTFRDIVDEMRLCFEIPHDELDSISSGNSADIWDDVAFGLADLINISDDHPPIPTFLHSNSFDQPVPALPQGASPMPDDRPVIQYRVFTHRKCSLSTDQPVDSHVNAGCAQHIPKPVRRVEPRYLPPKKPSADPRFAAYPLRKTARARKGSRSPSKRSASGSVSPSKDSEIGQPSIEEDDLPNMVTPPQENIQAERAKHVIARFRDSCLAAARQCAVSGMGRSWYANPTIGPALQACHIVPQQHYHLYPDPEAVDGEVQPEGARFSNRRLMQAWESTWDPANGILLLSHLHELFDARLFSIHPKTLRIRVFMPYDVLLGYHGALAKVPRSVDRAALRHHYKMCCIENMAAKMAYVEPMPWSGSAATSGKDTPLDIRTKLAKLSSPSVLESPSQSRNPDSQAGPNTSGDPSKRARDTQPGEEQHVSGSTDDSLSDDDSLPSSPRGRPRSKTDDWERQEVETLGFDWLRKRKRLHSVDEPFIAHYDNYMTPDNADDFLADVNWELTKVARRSYQNERPKS